MNDFVAAWFWPLFPLLFVGLFGAVSWILATAGGWRRLAEAYPDDAPVEGTTFRWQSAQFGSANYGGCLTFTADPSRLRLTVLWPFRFGHQPISAPGGDIRVELTTSWLREVGTLRFAREPDVEVRIDRRLVHRIAEASRGQLRIDTAG